MSLDLTFRTLRRFLTPRWLTAGEGGLVGYALDLVADAFVERVRLGLMARLPQNDPFGVTTAPPDALIAMGRDRRVVRGIFDTDATYAAHLLTWLDDRKTTGNPFTLMRQLHAYTGTANGVSFRTVDNSGNWYARSAAGVETSSLKQANWNWDATPSKWSRFWVIIYPGTLWVAESTFGTGVYGDDPTGTLGSTATPEQVAILRALIADWKPAGTVGQTILALTPGTFDPAAPEPDGLWGRWHKNTTPAVASRLASGRYIDGA